jgi:hypothetical protein
MCVIYNFHLRLSILCAFKVRVDQCGSIFKLYVFNYVVQVFTYILWIFITYNITFVLHTMGSQKDPGMLILHSNGRTCGSAYTRALTHTHTHSYILAPSILSLLEPPAEGLFWNLSQFGCRFRLGVLHGCETCPLEAHFQSRQQLKVTRSEIRRVRWLDGWWQELLHNKRCVARCIIVMQKPLSLPAICRVASSAKLARSNDQ